MPSIQENLVLKRDIKTELVHILLSLSLIITNKQFIIKGNINILIENFFKG